MQPLIEEIIELAKSNDDKVREEATMLLTDITQLRHESRSYEKRIEIYFFLPEKYQLMFVFDEEYGEIANFLSRMFIDRYAENSEYNPIPFYLAKIYHEDALEPLLDIMMAAPERFDEEEMGFQLILAFDKLLGRYERAYKKRKLKKLLKTKSPIPLFRRWSTLPNEGSRECGTYWLEHLKEKYNLAN